MYLCVYVHTHICLSCVHARTLHTYIYTIAIIISVRFWKVEHGVWPKASLQ